MQLKYRGIAYTPKAEASVHPFTVAGCYRGRPTQLGTPQSKLGLRTSHQLVYRGVRYQVG